MRATNHASMKQSNRSLALNCIRRQPLSRADIADQLHLTRAAVTKIVEELLAEKYLLESTPKSKARGRHPVLLHLRPDKMHFGGVDIRREEIVSGIVNFCGDEVARFTFAHRAEPPIQYLRQICGISFGMLGKVTAVGITAPGPIDADKGVILNPPRFNDWHSVDVVGTVSEHLGLPVYLENIAEAVALEEYYYNGMDNCERFLALLVNSGIGSGVMINGKSIGGSELGHMSIKFNGRPCECGNVGCVERYASMPAILEGTGFCDWRELMDDGGAAAQAVLEREADYLSQAIINAINMLRINKVVIRGDVSYQSERLCELINAIVLKRTVANIPVVKQKVIASEVPCSVRTAAMPAIHHFFSG